jgi:TonB-linked SusC/RagA family outer membrane protein
MKKNDQCEGRHLFKLPIIKILRTMKLTIVMVCFTGLLSSYAATYAQNTKMTMNLKGVEVKAVLQQIENQSEFSFMYDNNKIDVTRKVDVAAEEKTVDVILAQVFSNKDVMYEIIDRHIVLMPAEAAPAAAQQAKKVTGKVTDQSGLTLPGVTVVVKGTTTGTLTDMNGDFSLTGIADNATLQFSFIGMKTQELNRGGKSALSVVMQMETIEVADVVITALGIKREKKALGYSVGEVKGELLTETPQTNVLNSLQGKVSGVRISQMDGTVGSSVNIIIRGAKSLSNDNQPLFVIDGVPVANNVNNYYQGADLGNAISDLNPDDVESVSVLKGASAAALYGSRAGNGVILITTKASAKGNKGIGVSVNSSVVFDKPYDYYPYQSQFGTGKAGAHLFSEGDNETWGSQLDKGEMWAQWNTNGIAAPLKSYKNRIQDFMRTGSTYTNNVSVNGSSDKGYFRLSVGDMRNTGMIPNTDMTRSTINLNTMYKLSDKVSVTANINWNETGSGNRPNINGDDRSDVIRSLYEKGAQVNINDLKQYWMPGLEGVTQRSNAAKQNNAYFVANENTNAFKRDRLISKVQMDWEITKELSLMGRFTRDAYTEGRESKKAFSTYGQLTGGYDVVDMYRKETNLEANLSYKKKINSDWGINAFVAANRMYTYSKYVEDVAAGLVIPGLYTISNGIPGQVTYNSSWSQKSIYSVYGMASIDYKGMAYVDLTARNDWSSTLPKANRSYFYPSASLSLLPSEMFTMPKWISYSKVRAGLAQVGSDTNPYTLNQYFSVGNDWGTAKQMYMSGVLKNSTLKPEQAMSKEIGADFKFFNNRLGIEGTYYVVQNRNQVLNISLPVESGATNKQINTGLIESKGWEFSLNTTPILTKDFKWDMNFNLTRNRTYLKQLAEGIKNVDFYSTENGIWRTYEGGLIGDIYMKPMLKVTDTSSPYYNYPIISSAGKYQTDTDPTHIVKVGNSNQDFVLAFQPTFTYKAFSLYANIEWNQGGQFFSITRMFMNNNGVNPDNTLGGAAYDKNSDIVAQIKANPDKYFGNWVGGRLPELGGFAWPVPVSGIPLARYADASFNPGVREVVSGGVKSYVENLGAAGAGTVWLDPFNANQAANRPFTNRNIYSSTYVKVREIALTYRLPKKLMHSISIQNASISAVASNIFEWTKAGVHIDPERAYKANGGAWTQGVEYYNMMPWTGSVGFKLNFDF